VILMPAQQALRKPDSLGAPFGKFGTGVAIGTTGNIKVGDETPTAIDAAVGRLPSPLCPKKISG